MIAAETLLQRSSAVTVHAILAYVSCAVSDHMTGLLPDFLSLNTLL